MAIVTDPILYLDTNHISALARYPESDESKAVLAILENGEARLGVSLLHLHELSSPKFVDRPKVGELLDRLPLAWARWVIHVFGDEIRAAIAKSLGTVRGVAAFYDCMEAAFVMPQMAAVEPSVALEAMAENPHLRKGLLRTEYAARLDASLKGNAAVMTDPLVPLMATMREEHDLSRTPAGLRLGRPLDPETIIKSVGGLTAFPAYQVFHLMHRTRLGDETFQTQGNDIVDELHACYGPYVRALLVDKATLGRLRSGRVPFIDRCSRHLRDAPRLLAA